MAFPFNDQVYTKSFTPREYQVELLYAARKRNIIVCLGKNTDRAFLVSKLIQEYARGNRRSPKEGGKRTLYLLETEERCSAKANHIGQLTDLNVVVVTDAAQSVDLENAGVATLTAETCSKLLQVGEMSPSLIDLIIVDGCHDPTSRELLRRALRAFSESQEPPRIVALAAPLFDLTEQIGRLSLETERLESAYSCEVETASDILSVLRYGPKPSEYVIEYDVAAGRTSLEKKLESCALHAMNFLRDHRYDPSEIYNDEFLEDIRKIPDPTEKPCEMMEAFLRVLQSLGAWCADRAALALIVLAEKLKIKTPYDRHYLLLNMVSSVMMKIRALCDEAFEPLTERQRILEHSRPKIHRLLATLGTYRPSREPANPDSRCSGNDCSSLPRDARRGGNRRWNDDSSASKMRATTKPTRPSTARHYRGNGGGGGGSGLTDPDLLCGIIFVDESFTAKILFHLLNDMSKCDEDFRFLSPLYAVERTSPIDGGPSNARDLESEHRKQEEVLKRFRIHECNLLIATSILEQGIEIPKCNFVMRYHFPENYQSYVQCKSRARAIDALHVLLVSADQSTECVRRLARYHYIEKILLEKCWNEEPDEEEELEADAYAPIFPRYRPLPSEDAPGVTFNSAISLINRYCAKLPSDTFTRLTPEWTIDRLEMDSTIMYTCSLRLPINSPLKYVVSSYAMPNRAMARRLAALQLCVRLHKDNEIDDSLSPIGKENFRARPEDAEVPALPDESRVDHSEARPGTTKRRQYYYKKTAEALTDCRPIVGAPAHLYHINMSLSCPLPEEQNTRGRRIYPPEESAIGFGILTLKPIPKLCPFPIYTRSGEVRVELRLCDNAVILDTGRIERVATFLNYTFTNVLRLQKYLMLFDPNASENSYTIVPVKTATGDNDKVEVDWDFLERIHENRETIPREVPQDERANFTFDPCKYHDAVIMPWYRNQDQPQYFYVAEICTNLDPKSAFPGDGYSTFEEYYLKKYNIQIQNFQQPLLDVDHTSARLNFLTPRYVNRKGVALPTSSEETKRAKRENLEQKQILVAELCAIHPFPASLWRQAVCLPCILYRINALLLADQIRCEVARSINLGRQNLDADFQWPPLNFGWSLAEVLNRSREMEKRRTASVAKCSDGTRRRNGTTERKETEAEAKTGDQLEIGTWSNEMAAESMRGDFETLEQSTNAPMAHSDSVNDGRQWGLTRYGGSPTFDSNHDLYDSDETCSDDPGAIDYSDDYDSDEDEDGPEDEEEDDDDDDSRRGLRISYMGENIAEAVEDETRITKREMSKKILRLLQVERESEVLPRWPDFSEDRVDQSVLARHRELQREFTEKRETEIVSSGSLITIDRDIEMERRRRTITTAAADALVAGCERRRRESKNHLTHGNYVEMIAEKLRADMSEEPLKVDDDDAECSRPEQASSAPSYVADERLSSFDEQPELRGHPGPSPSLILQALTMSNANDGINLERLETIGDSFLKYAITTYLYCTYDRIHEGKLSHLRSKQVSNLNLYRLGRRKMLGESMIATKFEPHDNWLPPCYYVPKELEQALIESGVPSALWNRADIPSLRAVDPSEITQLVRETEHKLGMMKNELLLDRHDQQQQQPPLCSASSSTTVATERGENFRCFIPYNLITQHSIPDKSIADCVEALIGAYLIACGPRGALLFMAWLGINVLPSVREERPVVEGDDEEPSPGDDDPGVTSYSKRYDEETGKTVSIRIRYGKLEEPRNPLSRYAPEPERELTAMLDGYDRLELAIGYKFRDRSYLLQAFTHASYQPNRLTDCYQRLEFLGDAVLDYLITRHLYEDSRQHSPGALTDLRSALVNNTIFASLAVRCGFHKYFRHLSPGLNLVIDRFVRIQEENGHSISEEYYLIGEEDREEAEDVEVPKALGDVFESLAGAIYLDSRMSLDAVWAVYYGIMKSEIEQFSTNVPKSPIRELLELEPETAKFGKPEKLADGRRVRVTVDVFGKGSFKGIGRNYRIAKCTAAKCALKKLKRTQQHAPRRDKL